MIDEEHVREELRLRPTEELLEILEERDEDEWRPEVFPLVEEVLRERDVAVPGAIGPGMDKRPSAPPTDVLEAREAQPVVLGRFDDDVEAQLCRMALAQAGIEARLVRLAPEQDGSDTQELLVSESQADAARAVLDAAEAGGQEPEGFRCGSCGFIAEPVREGSRLVCQVCGESS